MQRPGRREHLLRARRVHAGPAGLGQPAPGDGAHAERGEHQRREDGAPAESRRDEAAEHGRQRIAEHRDHRERGEHLRHALGGVEVGDDGARRDEAGRGAEGLQRAAGDQPVQALGGQAHGRAADHDREPAQDRRAAPVAVRDRAPGQDAERERDERDRERRLHRGDARAEILADLGQRGQVEVGRDRAERGDRREQQQQAAVGQRARQPSMPPMQRYLSSV